MKSRRLLPALGLLLCSVFGLSQRLCAESFDEVYEYLSEYFGFDSNAGLTTMPSLLIPMGGLSEGLGMATTAFIKDSSYFDGNPAASSMLDQTELAVYHNNWIADTRIESAVYTSRYKNLGLGAACKWLYLPFTAYNEYGDRTGAGYYSEASAALNISYNLFQGYYFSGLSIGASAKAVYRSMPASISYTDSNGNTRTLDSNSAFGAMADLGLLTRFNLLKFYASQTKNCAFGLSVLNLGPPVQDDPLPTVACAGLSLSPWRPVTFLFQFSQPINLVDVSSSGSFYCGMGTMVAVTNFFSMHGGFLLKGGNPRISLGSSFLIDEIKLVVNYTLDLTTQFTPLNRVSVTASFELGDRGRAELAKKVQNLYLSGLEAYAHGDLATAIAVWTEALRLDPGFDPARESLHVVQGSKDLKQNIEDLQKLD